MSRWSYEDLQGKIDWEGGVDSALRYGIGTDVVPKDLVPLWESLTTAHEAYSSLADQVMAHIEAKAGGGGTW